MDILPNLAVESETCEAPFTFGSVTVVVIISCVLGLIWAAFNFVLVKKINVANEEDG